MVWLMSWESLYFSDINCTGSKGWLCFKLIPVTTMHHALREHALIVDRLASPMNRQFRLLNPCTKTLIVDDFWWGNTCCNVLVDKLVTTLQYLLVEYALNSLFSAHTFGQDWTSLTFAWAQSLFFEVGWKALFHYFVNFLVVHIFFKKWQFRHTLISSKHLLENIEVAVVVFCVTFVWCAVDLFSSRSQSIEFRVVGYIFDRL